MIVLSLFDGMSCGQIALTELGVKIERYYASEVDKQAISQTQTHYVCGMSVPPVMMAQVATQIYEQWLSKI